MCNARRFDDESPKAGFCGALGKVRIFRHGPHFGEEPPICGRKGSGCIFFSRCTMKCAYCQNSPWSWEGRGEDMEVASLAAIMRNLACEDGVDNWNLVSPTPYLPFIDEARAMLQREGVRLPFVWNSSGYERLATLEAYSHLVDWALFDLRYSRSETSTRLSASPNYVEAARKAVEWAYNRNPERLIVRILVLPGLADEAIENLAYLAARNMNDVAVSLMSQYTPAYKALGIPPLDRQITHEEYESVTEAAADFGFTNGWIQDYSSSDPALAFLGENMSSGHGAVGL